MKPSRHILIRDELGYYVRTRRTDDGTKIFLWSTRKRDAFHFHFLEAAKRTALELPQKVRFETI